MRRAALSSTALQLPPSPSGVRHGIFIMLIGKQPRTVYQQLDGEIILADECKCFVDWPDEGGPFGLSFTIERRAECPIDEHKQMSLREMQREEA